MLKVMYDIGGDSVNLLMVSFITEIKEERFVHKDEEGEIDYQGAVETVFFNIVSINRTQFSVTSKNRAWLEHQLRKLKKAIDNAWHQQNKNKSKTLAKTTFKEELKHGIRRTKTKTNKTKAKEGRS